MKLLRRAIAFLAWSSLVTAAGCANQREGERCDGRNASIDCESGLYCKQVGGPGSSETICCPISGVVTAAICNSTGGVLPDAGTADAQSEDATEDATTDGEDAAPTLSAPLTTTETR